jgi:hypothetical protein
VDILARQQKCQGVQFATTLIPKQITIRGCTQAAVAVITLCHSCQVGVKILSYRPVIGRVV